VRSSSFLARRRIFLRRTVRFPLAAIQVFTSKILRMIRVAFLGQDRSAAAGRSMRQECA